ncbi:hypothetical protein DFQ14_10530 [Halopolyspora algeriensis]|uniref:Secreted protein n=1 Tax=Halopolyspora algeriensis TaxID=1500506 RepID=A0A368VPW5_9ACTN|nr:hypothetical protein [Halopolyspora algeriensis]RCW43889.1 hypothetical protein DFQ14_10530 [Halopolyspora algeriensis]TQM53608.1 hypothetical protein FHU43_1769 [Halopolyspora algeriensis]
MRRLFWFGAGVAAGVALSRKAGETARRATPVGVADQLGGAVRELAGAVGSFGAEVRAGMAERERELHETVTERSGVDADRRRLRGEIGDTPRPGGAASSEARPGGDGERPAARRARRAGR